MRQSQMRLKDVGNGINLICHQKHLYQEKHPHSKSQHCHIYCIIYGFKKIFCLEPIQFLGMSLKPANRMSTESDLLIRVDQ